MKQLTKGFTLIEILVVIGIIAILAAIVIVAINPARQFAQARNTARTSDVSAISNAIGQYISDHKGIASTTMKGPLKSISKATADLCTDLVPTYLAALPVDPSNTVATSITDCTLAYTTGYAVGTTSSDRFIVKAPNAELNESIEITR